VRNAHVAAVVTWFYAAGFGLSTIPVAIYLRQRGKLPSFFGMFETYGGPWSARVTDSTFVVLLMAFLVVCAAAAGAGWLLWGGSRLGAVVGLALLPVEAFFWIGFALPIPWLLGIARVVLIVLAWKSLR
jgi:hypothetical protein